MTKRMKGVGRPSPDPSIVHLAAVVSHHRHSEPHRKRRRRMFRLRTLCSTAGRCAPRLHLAALYRHLRQLGLDDTARSSVIATHDGDEGIRLEIRSAGSDMDYGVAGRWRVMVVNFFVFRTCSIANFSRSPHRRAWRARHVDSVLAHVAATEVCARHGPIMMTWSHSMHRRSTSIPERRRIRRRRPDALLRLLWLRPLPLPLSRCIYQWSCR